jgi:stress response protein SCP2
MRQKDKGEKEIKESKERVRDEDTKEMILRYTQTGFSTSYSIIFETYRRPVSFRAQYGNNFLYAPYFTVPSVTQCFCEYLL